MSAVADLLPAMKQKRRSFPSSAPVVEGGCAVDLPMGISKPGSVGMARCQASGDVAKSLVHLSPPLSHGSLKGQTSPVPSKLRRVP
jgi:hypothetical protein